jgi:hypothetical protein
MNFKKLITNTLAVVGAVVIVDKVVNTISTKSTKAISEALMNDNLDEDGDDDSNSCQFSFLDDDYEENLNACHCGESDEINSSAFPDIKKYINKNSKDTTFQYAIKTEPTTDTPKEV